MQNVVVDKKNSDFIMQIHLLLSVLLLEVFFNFLFQLYSKFEIIVKKLYIQYAWMATFIRIIYKGAHKKNAFLTEAYVGALNNIRKITMF